MFFSFFFAFFWLLPAPAKRFGLVVTPLVLQFPLPTTKSLSKSESEYSEELESQLFRIAAAASAETLDLQRLLREAISSIQD